MKAGAAILLATACLYLGSHHPIGASPAIEFLPPEAIRPGMEGVARTVFEGNVVEEFKVEFLGVLKGAIGPQQDMILARLRGEKVEYTGVVSGMSGSPVYVDGRLVGAIAYRIGPFAKEAIAGITPIADMVKAASPSPRARPASVDLAPDLLGRFLQGRGDRIEPTRAAPAAATGLLGGLQPIATPLACSGCDPGVLRYYAPIFEAQGLEPTTGGGATEVETPFPLLPGSAIGAALATGDLSLTAIGTVTHVEGSQVFAFGHPLLGTGPLEIPMIQAQVLVTFPSTQASFKVANATRPMGTVLEDRLTAIVGEVGRVAPTLPLKVRVASASGRREFNYEIARNRVWTPVMVAVTTANSLVRTTEYDASATLALHYRIDLEGYPSVQLEDLYSGTNPGQPVHLALANEAAGLFSFLYNNPFEELPVRSATADIDLLEDSQVARIDSLSASSSEVRPGEPFTVTVVLSPFRGEGRSLSYEVVLPEDTTPGEAQIVVGNGRTMEALDRRVLERQLAQAGSLRDLIRLVSRQKKSRTLYLRVTRRSPSAIVRSEILPDLPLSIFTVLNNPRLSADATLMMEAAILEIPKDLDLVTLGGRRISIRVK